MSNGRQLVFEDVMVGGPPPLQLTLTTIPLNQIELDPDNPRLKYSSSIADGKTAFELLFAENDTKELKEDIKRNGLFERPFVRAITDKNRSRYKDTTTHVVFEGNRRIACFQQLALEDNTNPMWQAVPVRVLPEHTSDRQLAMMLGQFHVAGKLDWNAHERAGHIYHMSEVLKMPEEEIKSCLHMGKPAIDKAVAAYRMMMETYIKIDEGTYRDKAEGKFSFFDEFYKQKALRDMLASEPQFADRFCKWVGEGRIPNGADVRRLPAILADGHAYRSFVETALKDNPWQRAVGALELSDVSSKSDFFKKLKLLISASKKATMGDVTDARKAAGRSLIQEAKGVLDMIQKQADHAA
jgi:hypothetical protein